MKNILKKTIILAATISSITAVLGLIGYIPGFGTLGSIREEFIPMAPSTAFSFLILNMFILILPHINWQRRNTVIGCGLALLVSLFGILETFDAFLGTDLNLENLLIPSAGTLGFIPIARMSPSTGAVFFIAGLATFSLIFYRFKKNKSPKLMNLAGILGALTMIIALIFLLAYIYGVPLLYEQGTLVPMAVTTAFGFLMLGVGLFASSDKTSIPLRFIAQPNTYAQLLRIFFPLSIIAVLTGSFVTTFIQFFSNVNAAFITAIIVVLVAVITGLLVSRASKIIGESIDEEQTKRKSTEVLLQEALNNAELYKDIFAHDMNNILQNILTANQIIIRTLEKGIQQENTNVGEMTDVIDEQVDRGGKLISNVRRLSQIEEQKLSLKLVDITKNLNASIQFLQNSYQNKKINIHVDSFQDALHIKANELIQDLFENILINAVKHNRNDIIEVKIKISRETQNQTNYCKIEFIDNGLGIEDERKETIFERASINKSIGSGMGLGLSLVKKIIDSYNGKIWVEDRIKGEHLKGANIIILLPMEEEVLFVNSC
ncbi:hypothetical protein LCGC14_1073180 [marine sediment metagenome]|uniref:histidine kinase n=1 Tax=marine sediment metagenome TaxID=412755 RepID=A0A0F9Q0R0_9ZZZZ|nr:MAG: Signal transduction histidine kinase [Candidatus Lokiarchaeum sp. GC14_75]